MSKNIHYVGRVSRIEVAIQDPTNDPTDPSTIFKNLGAVQAKSIGLEGNQLQTNNSSSTSGFDEAQLGTSSFTISASGLYVDETFEDAANNTYIAELQSHYFSSIKPDLSESPIILVKYVRPDITITAYMIIASINVDDNDAELSTWSMELVNAPSPLYPLTVAPTV